MSCYQKDIFYNCVNAAKPESVYGTTWENQWFKLFWLGGIALLMLNLGWTFKLGNINNVEKAVFLIASLILLFKSPLNKISLIGYGFIAFSILFFGALTEFSEYSWSRLGLAFTALLSLLNFFIVRPSDEDRLLILRTLAFIAPLLVLYSIGLSVAGIKPLYMKDHTGAMRMGGATYPAFLAAAAYCSAIAAASLFMCTRKPFYIVLVFACLFISILSGSRMPSLCAALSSFAILFVALKSWSTRAGFVMTGLLIMGIFLITLGDQILLRFMSHSSSGRDLLWGALQEWIHYYPWFGVGFGHHHLLIPAYVTQITGTIAPHNEYIRLSAELGYPGASLFILGIVFLYFFSATNRHSADFFMAFVVTATHLLYAYSDNVFFLTYCYFGPLAYALGSGLKYSPLFIEDK